MDLQGQPTTIDLVLTTLRAITNKEPANAKIEFTLADASGGADLEITASDDLSYSGPTRFSAPNLDTVAAFAGVTLADGPGFDSLDVKGDLEGGGTALRLTNATINFDAIAAQGVFDLDWGGARAKAGGILSTTSLDLRPYLPEPATGQPEGVPEWSTDNIDFSSLRNLDGAFDISADAVYLNGLTFTDTRLKLTIENGRLVAEIPELTMYGGQGSGQLVVNARSATPSFSGTFDLGAVRAEGLTADLLKIDNLLGLGAFKFNFNASGANQAAIMSTLDGGGDFDLAEGALKGDQYRWPRPRRWRVAKRFQSSCSRKRRRLSAQPDTNNGIHRISIRIHDE